MEDFRETNFKKIQQLLDKCVAHEYGMKTNALALKREYLTEAQMKDYIRQEIFNVTKNLVSLCQKNRALHNIRFDILMPDFLWESGFFENLSLDERKKYISFQCSSFDMDKYLQSSTCYDEQLPFFSSIVRLVMQTQYLEYLQQLENASHASVPLDEKSEEQPKKEEKAQPEPTKIVGKSNPFKSVFTTNQTVGRMYQRSAHIHHDNHSENPFGLLRLQTERGIEVQQQPLAGLSDDAA